MMRNGGWFESPKPSLPQGYRAFLHYGGFVYAALHIYCITDAQKPGKVGYNTINRPK